MQKYQVFVNRHCIFFSTKDKSIGEKEFDLMLELPPKELIKALINDLLNEEQLTKQILIYHTSVLEAWQQFNNCFKQIEAAGGLVENSDKAYLFIYRLGHWDLPKGKLEKGESAEEGALREVEEECGISNLKIESTLASTYHIYRQKEDLILKKTHWFLMAYKGEEELVPQTEEAIEKVIWLKRKDVESYLPYTYESIKALLRLSIIKQ